MKKGFTLIELLAVIVILAIIALIATPIILGIINDAREKANERSVELYASAVRNAIASYQLTNPTAPTSFSDLDVQYDGNIECSTEELYSDGSFYIADCTVNGTEVEYTYGTQQVTQVYKPQYYSWSSGNIGENLPSDAKTTVAELNPWHPFYLGLDVDSNNQVTAVYTCFIRNNTEYCLKGNDANAYEANVNIIKDAYSDVVDTDACSFGESQSNCETNSIVAGVSLAGNVNIDFDGGYAWCSVENNGSFSCFET